MSTFASTAMPIVSTMPAMPGSVSVAPKAAEERQQEEHVQHQRDVGEHARAAVVEDHEEDHERRHRRAAT